MKLSLGTFHEVIGAGLSQAGVSILTREGVEHIVSFNASRDGPLLIEGEFGDFSSAESMEIVTGVCLEDIAAIGIPLITECSDFHTRELRMRDNRGVIFTWTLFCDGSAADYQTERKAA